MFENFRGHINEKGSTIIGLLIALAIVGVLAHPKISPFRDHYFSYLAKSDLKKLHKNCKKYWAVNISRGNSSDMDVAMSADLFTSKVKGETTEAGICSVETISQKPYDFVKNGNVTIKIVDGSYETFAATAKHSEGKKTFAVDTSGDITG